MRETLYRAWDRRLRKMFAVRTLPMSGEDTDCTLWTDETEEGILTYDETMSGPGIDGDKNDLVFMQYTGLEDKNGKKIFDRDLVRVHNFECKSNVDGDCRTFEIYVNGYTFGMNNAIQYMPLTSYDHSTLEPYEIEVIGNMFENADLLPKQQ